MSAEVNGNRKAIWGPSALWGIKNTVMHGHYAVIVGGKRPKKNDTISSFSKRAKASNMFMFESQGL